MSDRARRPTDLGTGAGAADMRGEYAPRRTLPPRDPPQDEPAPASSERDPAEVGRRDRPAEQATPVLPGVIDDRRRLASEPAAVPAVRGAERSEPIRVISMKDQTQARRRRSDQAQAPLQVQLRSLAEISRRRADTPVGLGNLAPPRDPREVRARRMRANLSWGCVALALAAMISLAIWLVAGR